MKKIFLILSIVIVLLVVNDFNYSKKIFKRYLLHMPELVTLSFEENVFNKDTAFTVPKIQKVIAHGGGQYKDMRVSNSMDALENNYIKGYRCFELDVNLTSNDSIAFIHDWETTLQKYFVMKNQLSFREYESAKMINGLHQITLHSLSEWLYNKDDVFIITDVKDNNIKVLQYIKEKYPAIQRHIIPQIYYFREYAKVRKMGYQNIILTLYRSNYDDELVVEFAKNFPLFGITMWYSRALTDLPLKLSQNNVRVFAHTVNDTSLRSKLLVNGVYGVYTDFLNPEIN